MGRSLRGRRQTAVGRRQIVVDRRLKVVGSRRKEENQIISKYGY